MRRIARRLAEDAADGNVDDNAVPDVLAQVQAEAAWPRAGGVWPDAAKREHAYGVRAPGWPGRQPTVTHISPRETVLERLSRSRLWRPTLECLVGERGRYRRGSGRGTLVIWPRLLLPRLSPKPSL